MRILRADPHPLLAARAFETAFSPSLGALETPPGLLDLLRPDVACGLVRTEELRGRVRDLLRHGGYKPTGRGKPSCEYLVRAAGEGKLGPINLAVDACNATSLHSGFPISVVDADRTVGDLRLAIAGLDTRYVFNASGQEIDVSGLLCLFDGEGPCANAVKDSQRTKTNEGTTSTVSVVWGVRGFEEELDVAVAAYRGWLADAGAETSDVELRPAD